jgi:hypothetical protein
MSHFDGWDFYDDPDDDLDWRQKQRYTVPVEDKMRVKHGAKVRFTLSSGRRTLEDDLYDPYIVIGAITRCAITYNGAAMSGGVSWSDPTTGQKIDKPKYQIRARSEDILVDKQECDCSKCEGGE